jgi:hypothetical protein
MGQNLPLVKWCGHASVFYMSVKFRHSVCVCVYVNYIQMKKLRIWTVHLKQNVDNKWTVMNLGFRGIDVASFSDFSFYYHDSNHKGCLHTDIQMKKLRIWTVHLKQNVDNDTKWDNPEYILSNRNTAMGNYVLLFCVFYFLICVIKIIKVKKKSQIKKITSNIL